MSTSVVCTPQVGIITMVIVTGTTMITAITTDMDTVMKSTVTTCGACFW